MEKDGNTFYENPPPNNPPPYSPPPYYQDNSLASKNDYEAPPFAPFVEGPSQPQISSAPYHTMNQTTNNNVTYTAAFAAPVQQRPLNFNPAIILSAFVYFCCCCLFGAIAFALALIGQRDASESRTNSRQLLRASYGVSVAGIVVGVVATVAIVVFYYYAYFNAVKEFDYAFSTKYSLWI